MSKNAAAAFPSKSLESLETAMDALSGDVGKKRVLMEDARLVDNLAESAERTFKSCRSSMEDEKRKLTDEMTVLVQRCAASQDTICTDRVHARIHIHLCARTD